MNKLLVIPSLLITLLLGSGCAHTYWNESSSLIPTDMGTTNTVSTVRVGQYAFLTKSGLQGFSFEYNGKKINVGNYTTIGDVDMMNSISKMVVYSIAAYGSMGAYPTTIALLEALKSGEVDKVVAKVNKGEPVTIDDFPVAAKSLCKPGQIIIQSKPYIVPTWTIPTNTPPIMLLTSP